MEEVEISEDGHVKCPECGHTLYCGDGTSEAEYSGGGYRLEWYTFTCPSCGAAFRSEAETKYA